ncbi:MAG: FCD domain-containing protein [Bacillota bacterium]|nr:FCD domain-containing protein [Bacillota bacterium]
MEILPFVLENEKQLVTFRSKAERIHFAIMALLEEAGKPLGAWAIQEALNDKGCYISSATIGRYLKELDIADCTVRDSNKGRVLTPAGRKTFNDYNNKIINEMFHINVKQEAEITNLSRLVDIYIVRKAIEREAVRLCVSNMTKEELSKLRDSIFVYKDAVCKGEDFLEPSLQFHAIIGEGSGNRVMDALIRLLLNSQKAVEAKMEELVTRNKGLEYIEDHFNIYQMICSKNETEAMRLMDEHFERIIKILSVASSCGLNLSDYMASEAAGVQMQNGCAFIRGDKPKNIF